MVNNLRSFERSELERNSPNNPLLTDQYTLAVSFVTYQLTSYFLLSHRYLIADTLFNIPPSLLKLHTSGVKGLKTFSGLSITPLKFVKF